MTALVALDAKVSGNPFGLTNYDNLKADIDYLIHLAQTGWADLSSYGAFSYASTDGPTFVMNTPSDLRSIIGLGDKIQVTQLASPGYYIVVAIGATTITLYGGTDYALANSAISAPYYSQARAPLGFPLHTAKWTVEIQDTTNRFQASPGAGTWYNNGSVQISVPIGLWKLGYTALLDADTANANSIQPYCKATLSTANNSESDSDLTTRIGSFFAVVAEITQSLMVGREKTLLLAAKTPYYLLSKADGAIGTVGFENATCKAILRAVCAYL